VRQALARPETYSHRPAAVEQRATHLTCVFLAGELAYKLKKPHVLDFVDYGTPERRRQMCLEEVRLNRRLAPDVHLGVRGVAPAAAGVDLTADDDPRAIDFVVEMRRHDEAQTLAARLERGELDRRDMIEVGRALARFHAGAPRVAPAGVPVLMAERRFERNLQELLGDIERRSEIERVHCLERFAHAFLTIHARTFAVRANRGKAREGSWRPPRRTHSPR
jgi:aminoglycoside phosphotransferase family enzyme